MTPGATEFDWVWDRFNQAAKDILGSQDTWVEEAHRPQPKRLLWPLPTPKRNAEKLAYWLGAAAVEHTFAALREAEGEHAVPQDVNSDYFQLVLRMARRVVERVYEEGLAKFGPGVLQGKREFLKRMREALTEQANRPGHKRENFADLGLSKSAAYRAEARARQKRN